MVSLYVDDLIYTGNDEEFCARFKQSMKKEFEMTDLGKMRFFLGVEVSQNANGIHLCQKKYAREVLERFNMWNCNSVKNPIVPGTVLTREDGEDVDPTLYKQLVGSLMYLTATRPDMMYVVCLISRYMANPKEKHMQIAKRALRYLKGTLDFGLFYRRKISKLLAYTDSDYARDVDDRKSTSGYVFMLSEAAMCWSSKKQAIVTLSSTEAEYVAATSCACHCVWVKGVLKQI
ncbi:secreted RxLR effector protein 161-like [Cicer arietinum]|uniref:secreted RxLR effector protein 161-like n=1 Tax=Cicer arietinum TaxID=3827 RepID=UPI003CC6A2EF